MVFITREQTCIQALKADLARVRFYPHRVDSIPQDKDFAHDVALPLLVVWDPTILDDLDQAVLVLVPLPTVCCLVGGHLHVDPHFAELHCTLQGVLDLSTHT